MVNPLSRTSERFDVIVVGAGPAGSTTAEYAAMGGAKTLILEKRKRVGYPVQCGEYLPILRDIQGILPRAPKLEELFDIPDGLKEKDLPLIRVHFLEHLQQTSRERLVMRHLIWVPTNTGRLASSQ